MNLSKSYDFFQPDKLLERIHVVGCGSVGSVVAENLARFGITRMSLYDFDIVEPRNLANQMFTQDDIGRAKVDALADLLRRINPEVDQSIMLLPRGYTGQKLSGYVFLCVDNIDLRRKIATANKNNRFIKGMFDFRTGLTDAQHYAANWKDSKMVQSFLNSMAFSHDEAVASTPVSACNVALSVCPTVRTIAALGVANFINFAKGGALRKVISIDAFSPSIEAF